jgi:hypothetical protein
VNRRRAVSVLASLAAVGGVRPTEATPANGPAFTRGRLFRVVGRGVAPSHVFGTLHTSDPRVIAVPPAVGVAFAASRVAAFEALLADGDLDAFFALAQFDDARRLTDHVDAATLERIRDVLGARAPSPATLVRLKPWAVLLMLAQRPDGGAGTLDGRLKAEAQARGLRVLGLELPEEQVASLDAVPLRSQLALMHWALATVDQRPAALEATTRAWLAGDLAGLWRLSTQPLHGDRSVVGHLRELRRHLVTNRNALFAHRLYLPLRAGRVFVAVGALHLHGPDGLLASIREQGFRVDRVL